MHDSKNPVPAGTNTDPEDELSFTGERVIPGKVDADLFNEHFARYVFARQFCSGRKVLDTGCGVGYGSSHVAEAASYVVGIDNDAGAVRFARAHYARPNATYLVGDCQTLPFQSQAFDVATSFELIEHLPDANRYLEEIRRVLKESGTLVVSTPNRPVYHEHLGDVTNPFHVREWDLEEFLTLLRTHFSFVEPLGEQHLSAVGILGPASSLSVPTTMEQRSELATADYFVCVCSSRPLKVSETVYAPASANVLLERERYIRALARQLNDRETYLARLQPEFEEKALWANKLNAELQESQARVHELRSTAQNLKLKVDELTILWSKATRWKRALIFSLLLPLDWLVGSVIIAAELFGRLLRKFNPRKAPLIAAQNSAHCSIVIVTWEGKDLLAESLPALLEAVRFHGAEHEIVVVDNGSTDGTEEYLHTHFPQVRVICNERNEFFGPGNNLGVLAARNDIVVLLNNDMIVHKDFLAPLLDGFRSEDVFAVASQVFLADSSKPREETGKTRATFNGCDLDWKHDPISRADEEQEYVPVFWGHGGAVAVDRAKFLWLGGFDRLYDPFYVEDADLSYQAWKVGWRCLLGVHSKVIHKHRSSTKRFGEPFIAQIVRRNHELFIWKNFGDVPKLFKHFLRAYRQRARRAGVPGIGIRLELLAWLGALKRLPVVLSRRLRSARSVVRGDQEILELTNQKGIASSHEVDFSQPSSQERLGPGWYGIESSGGRPYCWMGREASLYVCAPYQTAELRIEGHVPPLVSYRAKSLTLTVCCGTEQAKFDLSEGPFDLKCDFSQLQAGKAALIQLSLSKAIPPTPSDSRTRGLIIRRVGFTSQNGPDVNSDHRADLVRGGLSGKAAVATLPDARKRLLFLCAYVPGVGLHGGGNTMFHLIRKLSNRYRITVLCLMEKEVEQKFVPLLAPFCERLQVLWRRQTLYARNPFGVKPPEIVYEFYHQGMQEAVDTCLRSESFDVVDCEYLQTAHFVQHYLAVPAVVSHHEVYSLSHQNRYRSAPRLSIKRLRGFTNWMRMLNYEREMFKRFHAVMVVTDKEKEYLQNYMPDVRVCAHPTGVDCDFFSPSAESPERGSVVFLGNFHHAPNVSGILWFLREVWHRVRERCPYSRLYVVGGNPPAEIKMWDGTERVTVTGWVDDVRSFLGRGSVFIAPMFEGVGLRGKILEAWAMAKPVVGTSLALQGLERAKGRAAIVADDPVSFADRLSELLEDENSAAAMGNLGRQLVVSSYSWDAFADLYHTVYCDAMRAQA